jgi:hypothetical protein
MSDQILNDIRERLVRIETTVNHMAKIREEDKDINEKKDDILHKRVKRVEDRIFTVAWGLVLTAITLIITLLKEIFRG